MSVLAHIVLDGTGLAPEPAATKAFAFILNSDREAAKAFVRRVAHEMDIESFELGRIEGQFASESGRPDLVIHDAQNRPRLIVEFKFWAGLTENQPVGYLNLLPADEQAALLFVVPKRRVDAVWSKLRGVCQGDGLSLAEGPDGRAMAWAQVGSCDGNRVLAITSWEHLFEELFQGVGDPDTRSNIDQLQGLTKQVTRRPMVSTALIVWWYGPYHGIEDFRENAANGAQLYMAVSEDYPCRVCHVGSAADPDVRFDADGPDRDDTFLGFAADGCGLYAGEISPTPAGAAGLAAPAERAAGALSCLLLGGPEPDDYVSLFSSFYGGEIDAIVDDYPLAAPLPGFPLVVAFNPFPRSANEGNWTIVRAPRFR